MANLSDFVGFALTVTIRYKKETRRLCGPPVVYRELKECHHCCQGGRLVKNEVIFYEQNSNYLGLFNLSHQ